ncbi:hypothetical protein O181_057482 [Austropuccinia psidii MF-1]|uniref:Uncharacterized protein n=1 Tax=Austropuccinia psidii MF-1 TaxID=1389203 RepID=A0A9Q3HVH4_9BASI|nr:hypothetical protein [Austropuccinia psidii MF-1]
MSAIPAKLNFKNQIQLASRKNLSRTSPYPSSPSSESSNLNSMTLIHPDSHSIHSNLSNLSNFQIDPNHSISNWKPIFEQENKKSETHFDPIGHEDLICNFGLK